jgi:hypothetical protein
VAAKSWSAIYEDTDASGASIAVQTNDEEPGLYRVAVDRKGESATSAKLTLDQLRAAVTRAAAHADGQTSGT